jgi:SAM-dependent methyltransferase
LGFKKRLEQIKWLAMSFEKNGLFYTARVVSRRILGVKIKKYDHLKKMFENREGIEIGGPSDIFRKNGYIPIYDIAKGLDGCNFSTNTVWEGDIQNGKPYHFCKGKNGVQFISEATNLAMVPDEKYDFLISSNCLEHIANPLKAITEWSRVLKKGGHILLILPEKDLCFDHRRPVTSYEHILNDFRKGVTEDDLGHLDEILELHDLDMDRPAGNPEQFRARSLKNHENRTLHHHVFDIHLLKRIFDDLHLEIMLLDTGFQNIIVGKKTIHGAGVES